ncbi:helix-turn-helix transcriptional regulator [bacterium]|nr:helix-turn-helix transcriptional regulator [bacterium]
MKKMFGERLRTLRRQKNLTQEQLAEIINIQPENYSRIENGLSFPKPENIVKISQALDVEIAELFQFSNINNYEQVLEKIISKLKTDEQTTAMTYKYLRSMGKI